MTVTSRVLYLLLMQLGPLFWVTGFCYLAKMPVVPGSAENAPSSVKLHTRNEYLLRRSDKLHLDGSVKLLGSSHRVAIPDEC